MKVNGPKGQRAVSLPSQDDATKAKGTTSRNWLKGIPSFEMHRFELRQILGPHAGLTRDTAPVPAPSPAQKAGQKVFHQKASTEEKASSMARALGIPTVKS